MTREFRKYLWYAVGEILLVVVGIFIALQIDTWYEDKQNQRKLNGYLENISQGISEDIQRLNDLKSLRSDTIFESFSTFLATSLGGVAPPDGWYNIDLTRASSRAIEKAQKKHYFVANSGSYRALESSGLTAALEDRDLETMLYDYYRTADRIAQLEREINGEVRELSLSFQTEASVGVPQIVVREPLLMWGSSSDHEESNNRVRESYWKLLTHSITHSLLRANMNQSIMQSYEHLLSLGQHIVGRIAAVTDTNSLREQALSSIYSEESNTGHPVLIERGRPGYHSYGVFTAPNKNMDWDHVYNRVWLDDEALNIQYPGGMPWAYLYVKVGPVDVVFERYTKDYSMYDKIRLELKRDISTECTTLKLEIKDVDDAFAEGLRSIPLVLTPQWQTYTFELAEFEEADLTRMNVVAGFLYGGDEPCRIAIRDVRYL